MSTNPYIDDPLADIDMDTPLEYSESGFVDPYYELNDMWDATHRSMMEEEMRQLPARLQESKRKNAALLFEYEQNELKNMGFFDGLVYNPTTITSQFIDEVAETDSMRYIYGGIGDQNSLIGDFIDGGYAVTEPISAVGRGIANVYDDMKSPWFKIIVVGAIGFLILRRFKGSKK